MFKVNQNATKKILDSLRAPQIKIKFDSDDIAEGHDLLKKIGPCGFCKGIPIKPLECVRSTCSQYFCSDCLKL